jgi:uncharacterized membrane protein
MVLSISRLFAALCLALLFVTVRPALAHEHNEQQEAAEQQNQAGHAHATAPSDMDEMMEHEHGEAAEEHRPTTFSGRLVAWLGNMHPFAVHFPIALIPASWLALVIARRRGHAVDVIRAVIMLAGLAAVIAALLGWLNGGIALADPNPIKLAHRWIGTTLAVLVGGVGVWAWRRTESVNSRAMVWFLAGATVLLLVQGWLGAVLTHGMAHMMF